MITLGDTPHGLEILLRDDGVERIYVRDGTVIRDDGIHGMYNGIPYGSGDLATVVSRNHVYGKIRDGTGSGIRHIGGIMNHAKVEGI